MNVFLVGNGFELHHMFPTSYIYFLHTLKFLIEKYDDSLNFVGKVFGDSKLKESNYFIKKCYETIQYMNR